VPPFPFPQGELDPVSGYVVSSNRKNSVISLHLQRGSFTGGHARRLSLHNALHSNQRSLENISELNALRAGQVSYWWYSSCRCSPRGHPAHPTTPAASSHRLPATDKRSELCSDTEIPTSPQFSVEAEWEGLIHSATVHRVPRALRKTRHVPRRQKFLCLSQNLDNTSPMELCTQGSTLFVHWQLATWSCAKIVSGESFGTL